MMDPLLRALCCGTTCGRPDKGKGACAAHNYGQAILARITAAGYAVEQGWQPIATAPKDGRRLLCYAPAADDRAAVWRVDYWWVHAPGFAHMRPLQPYTYWRPLHTPPQELKP